MLDRSAEMIPEIQKKTHNISCEKYFYDVVVDFWFDGHYNTSSHNCWHLAVQLGHDNGYPTMCYFGYPKTHSVNDSINMILTEYFSKSV